MRPRVYPLFVLQEKLQIDLENGLQKSHVGALVQTDLVLPDVDNQYLTCRQSEQGAFTLKILILASFATISTLDVHDQDILGQLDTATRGGFFLILGHPYSFSGLTTLAFAHYTELGAKEIIQQGGFAGGLGTEDGDEVVVEARLSDVCLHEVVVEDGARSTVSL